MESVMDYAPQNECCRVCDYPPPHELKISKSSPGKLEVICIACRTMLDLVSFDSESEGADA